jgi:hypothetical protein
VPGDAPDRTVTLTAGELALTLDLRRGARVTALTHLGAPTGPTGPSGDLLDRWWSGYTADGRTWSDDPQGDEAAFAAPPAGGPVERSGRVEVVARVASPHLRLEKRFTVYPGLPFLRVRYRAETTGVEGRGPGLSLALPGLRFSRALADPFDLDADTADDGRDLDGALALPAWRVFADPGGDFGLLVFAAERQTMSRLQVTERGCAFRPPYYLAYSTDVVGTRELRLGRPDRTFGPGDALDWFVGAYRRQALPGLLRHVAGFHARRRPVAAGDGVALEVSPDAPAHVLPPPAALPPAWPAAVRLAPGAETTRRFVWLAAPPGGDGAAAPAALPAPAAQEVRFAAAAAEPPGRRAVEVALPAGSPGAGGARLVVEVEVVAPPPLPVPAAPGEVVLGAAALAAPARAAGWRFVAGPETPGGGALLARPGDGAGPFRVDPRPAGGPGAGAPVAYDVWAGLAGGVGLKLRLDGDPYWTYVTADPEADVQLWRPVAAIARGLREARLRRAAPAAAVAVEVAPHPNVQGATVLTHLRFVPVAAAAAAAAPAAAGGRVRPGRRRTLAGLADTPDVAFEVAADAFEEGAWRESLWQHAAHGIDTVYWRIDGQCSDFHTRVGTVRYPVPRTHSLYSPVSRYYGQALRRLDPLRVAVEERRRWGLRLFGWMRTNNYSGNAVARFYLEHPEWREARADGRAAPQLCFAVPEVRAHKIAILQEAVAYGLDGLLIDTLRHPPMVGYHPLVAGAYRTRYGQDPPRRGDPEDAGADADADADAARWHRFRARYFTRFLRELRHALAGAGRAGLPVHLRVAPRRALHDGADLEALLDEGLIDGLVANRYTSEPLDYERLFPLVRGRVPVYAVCDPLRGDPIAALPDLWRDRRLAGAGVYESEWSVHTPAHREVLLDLKSGR